MEQPTNREMFDALNMLRILGLGFECTCCGQEAKAQCLDHDEGYGVCDRCLEKYGRTEFCQRPDCTAHDKPSEDLVKFRDRLQEGQRVIVSADGTVSDQAEIVNLTGTNAELQKMRAVLVRYTQTGRSMWMLRDTLYPEE